MSDFEYKVSVIVPIYNVEQYLRGCLDSLLAQTINHDQMEVLLINDGSTDNSLGICEEYAELFSSFKVFSQENAGVSAARNVGICNAKGKYIMFLDADDSFSSETLKEVSDFFDTIYDKVDVVTYKRTEILNGEVMPLNYRYKYLKKSGVYSIEKYPFMCITTLNIAVKNKLQENLFFNTAYSFGEDTSYIDTALQLNGNIGYCDKGEYVYLMQRDGGAVNLSNFKSILQKLDQFEEALFGSGSQAKEYFQAIVFSDLNWLLRTNRLFPPHLSEEEDAQFKARIKKIVSAISDNIILTHPNCNYTHKSYWLKKWKDKSVTVISDKNKIQIFLDDKCIYNKDFIDMIYHKIFIGNGSNSYIYGFIKSDLFCFLNEKPQLYAIINDNNENKIPVNVRDSIHSCNLSRTRTNDYWCYKFYFDAENVKSVEFVVEFDKNFYKTNYWFMRNSIINPSENRKSVYNKGFVVSYDNSTFYLDKLPRSEINKVYLDINKRFVNQTDIFNLRKMICDARISGNRIWIYSDEATVQYDNAYYQFIHDFDKNDGVKRYYIFTREFNEIKSLFEDRHLPYLVQFGSLRHKLLYANSEYVISSFFNDEVVCPFNGTEKSKIIDLFEFETIYLQHGVLHATLPLVYHAERCSADKIVVSSKFEVENFTSNYGYDARDIIQSGMPRFEHIKNTKPTSKKILFAPSWRTYFESRPSGHKEWILSEKKFLLSSYFKNIKSFFANKRLLDILESQDITLDFKLHPNAYNVKDFFDIESDRIRVLTEKVELSEYSLFITDFSSFVFDYAYLSRAIVYFVPDYEEFISGMNHYCKLDLPWENAFGRLTVNPEDAVNEVIRIIDGDFAPNPVFKKRMENFFLPLDNCAEKLYRELTDKK